MLRAVIAFRFRLHVALGMVGIATGLLAWLNPALSMHGAAMFRGTCSYAPGLFAWSSLLPPMPWMLLLFIGLVVSVVFVFNLYRHLGAAKRIRSQVTFLERGYSRRLAQVAWSVSVEDRVTLVEDPLPYAFCWGFLRPSICVSSGLVEQLDSEELRAVLLHERHHLKRRDPLRLLLARLATILVPIPVFSEVSQRFRLSRELGADASALRWVPRHALAGAMLKTSLSSAGAQKWEAVCAFGLTEARARHLAGLPVVTRLSHDSLVASAVMLAGLVTVAFGITAGTAYLTTAAIHCTNFLLRF